MATMTWVEIVELAKRIGMRQWQLAHRLGVSDVMVSRWVSGARESEPRRAEAERIIREEAEKRAAELNGLTNPKRKPRGQKTVG